MTISVSIILAGVSALLLAGLWAAFTVPWRNRIRSWRDLDRMFAALLRDGLDGALMAVQHRGGQRFLQFAKYIRGVDQVSVEFAFPLAPWSEPYYRKVQEALENLEVPYIVQRTQETPTREFTIANLGTDLTLAARVAVVVLQRVFDLAPEECYVTFRRMGYSRKGRQA